MVLQGTQGGTLLRADLGSFRIGCCFLYDCLSQRKTYVHESTLLLVVNGLDTQTALVDEEIQSRVAAAEQFLCNQQ